MREVDDIFLWAVALTLPVSVAAYYKLRTVLKRAGRDVDARRTRFKMMILPLAIGVIPVWVLPRLSFEARLGLTLAAFLIPYVKFVAADYVGAGLKRVFCSRRSAGTEGQGKGISAPEER